MSRNFNKSVHEDEVEALINSAKLLKHYCEEGACEGRCIFHIDGSNSPCPFNYTPSEWDIPTKEEVYDVNTASSEPEQLSPDYNEIVKLIQNER